MRKFNYVVANETCRIYVPEHEEDLEKFKDFLAEGHQFLAYDTESTGLNTCAPDHELRLVQIGTATEAWVLRVDRFREILRWLFTQRRNFIAHNAPFDALVIDRHLQVPIEQLLTRTWDTKITAHLADPRGRDEGGIGLKLKELATVHIDPLATDGEQELTKVFNSFGWTKKTGWARIAIDHAAYLIYAGLDVILTSRLFDKLWPIAQMYPELCKMEHRLQYYLTLLQRRGMLLDVDYVNRLVIDLHNDFVHYCDVAFDLGVESVHANEQVARQLVAMGETLTATTPSGALQVDKAVLEPLADLNRQFERINVREPNPLADAVLRAKRASKWSESYAMAFLNLKDADNRLHPGINSLQARTARMCLPESEKLLTKQGVRAIDEVKIGDETIDADGNWVKVTGIYRYPKQEVIEYRSNNGNRPGKYAVHSTREHRWLQRSPRGRVFLEPINSARPKVILAPPRYPAFGTEFIANTEGERFASIIGLLATDGRLHVPTEVGVGMMAVIYQTERKFYQQILSIIPDGWLSYDRVTNGHDHHEIGLRIREIRPHLESRNLVPIPGNTIKDHPQLIPWVCSLPLNEVAAFFRATYMADGSVSSGNKVIYIRSENLREAVRIAAYRLGWLTSLHYSAPSEWSNGPRAFLSFRRASLYLRDRLETVTIEDVWCVSTETGTFTADGELGLYLTGNSIDRPPLQQLPSGEKEWRIRRAFIADPDMTMIACDYQAIEMRILAALSDDWTMKNAIAEGHDLHSFTAEKIYGPTFTKQQRKIAKNVGFGKVYGGGAGSVARLTGADEEGVRAAMKAYDQTFPGIRRYSQKLIRQAKSGMLEVITPIGRRLPLDEDRLYAATNYMVQSTARDVLAKAIIRAFDAGLGDYLLIPVHDELIGQAPIKDAQEIVTELGKVMSTKFQGVELPTKPEVIGFSWGLAYGAPKELPAEVPVRRERKLRAGQWAQESLDLRI